LKYFDVQMREPGVRDMLGLFGMTKYCPEGYKSQLCFAWSPSAGLTPPTPTKLNKEKHCVDRKRSYLFLLIHIPQPPVPYSAMVKFNRAVLVSAIIAGPVLALPVDQNVGYVPIPLRTLLMLGNADNDFDVRTAVT
jgi:hypothetical protein